MGDVIQFTTYEPCINSLYDQAFPEIVIVAYEYKAIYLFHLVSLNFYLSLHIPHFSHLSEHLLSSGRYVKIHSYHQVGKGSVFLKDAALNVWILS